MLREKGRVVQRLIAAKRLLTLRLMSEKEAVMAAKEAVVLQLMSEKDAVVAENKNLCLKNQASEFAMEKLSAQLFASKVLNEQYGLRVLLG